MRFRPHAGFVSATVGFGALYAVAVVFFYCDWLFDVPGANALAYGALLNLSLCAAAAAVFAAARRLWWNASRVTTTGVALYAVALGALVASTTTGSPALALGAGVAAGAAVGVLMPLWFGRIVALAADRYPAVLGAGSLIAAPAALVLDASPLPVLAVGCAMLVALSVALLLRAPRSVEVCENGKGQSPESVREARRLGCEQGAQPAARQVRAQGDGAGEGGPAGAELTGEDSVPAAALVVPGLYVLILSFAYGMLDVVAMASPVASASLSGFASQAGGLVAIGIFLVYVRIRGARYTVLLNGALAVVATGVLFLPFLPEGYSIVLVVITHMGWEVALLVLYTLAIGAFCDDRVALLGWGALAFALPRPALLAGSAAAAFLADGDQFAFTQMTVVAFALLYLIVSGVALLRSREQRAYQRALRRKDELIRRYQEARRDLQGLACEELATASGLTKREAELLVIFAQGRDSAYAERTLFLSRNTVKSYRKSLYAKLGVHSKQELIDRVNAAMPTDL